MLLGTAKYLAETRNFAGPVALIFQPAEETIGGARIMCEEGLIERYDIQSVFAMHSLPDLPLGQFETCSGPIMAAADDFKITINGKGGHAAHPNETVDPIAVGTAIYQGLQTVVSRNIDPIATGVLSLTKFNAGSATNVIPDQAVLEGTIRTFEVPIQDLMRSRLEQMATTTAQAFGATAEIEYITGYPATVNVAKETEFAVKIAGEIVGAENVNDAATPSMGAEDFSFMLQKCPGSYVYIGNGPGAALHHPNYNFNDDASPIGASYFAKLVETALPTDS
jgi:hippurate hydrolase